MLYYILLLSMPGGGEWILIFLAVLLLFGGRKIPELMKGIGKGIREFNEAKEKVKTNLEEGMKKEDEKKEEIDKNLQDQYDKQSK
jgi:sec-independent protein translocase protein TatA